MFEEGSEVLFLKKVKRSLSSFSFGERKLKRSFYSFGFYKKELKRRKSRKKEIKIIPSQIERRFFAI